MSNVAMHGDEGHKDDQRSLNPMINYIVPRKRRNRTSESARIPTPEEQRRQSAFLDHKALQLRGEEIEIAVEFEKHHFHNQYKGDQ